MKPTRKRRIIMDCLILTVMAGTIAAGASAFKTTLRNVMLWGGPTISQEMKNQVKIINSFVPDRAPLFYIDPRPDLWLTRFWQRVLYPRPVFLVGSLEQMNDDAYLRFKSEYGIRYAVSAGMPALEPRFIRSRNIGPPGTENTLLVGELAP